MKDTKNKGRVWLKDIMTKAHPWIRLIPIEQVYKVKIGCQWTHPRMVSMLLTWHCFVFYKVAMERQWAHHHKWPSCGGCVLNPPTSSFFLFKSFNIIIYNFLFNYILKVGPTFIQKYMIFTSSRYIHYL